MEITHLIEQLVAATIVTSVVLTLVLQVLIVDPLLKSLDERQKRHD